MTKCHGLSIDINVYPYMEVVVAVTEGLLPSSIMPGPLDFESPN